MLICSGTNYLGVNRNAEFQRLVREGIDRYGLHYGGSRFSSLCPDIFEKAEALFCNITGAEAAVIVSSGTAAGLLGTSLIPSDARVWAAPDTHPSLLNIKAEVDFRSLTPMAIGTDADRKRGSAPTVVLSNAIDPLHCQSTDFSFLQSMNIDTQLIVDDSHGLGVTGNSGGGIYRDLKKQMQGDLIVTSSLAKAFGIPGGVILSDRSTIHRIKMLPMFGGGAPPPPAYFYAFIHGQAQYDLERMRLSAHIQYFVSNTKKIKHFNYLDNYPVFSTTVNALSAYLEARGILISSFRYPTPDSDLITRVVLGSNIKQEELDQLIKSIDAFDF